MAFLIWAYFMEKRVINNKKKIENVYYLKWMALDYCNKSWINHLLKAWRILLLFLIGFNILDYFLWHFLLRYLSRLLFKALPVFYRSGLSESVCICIITIIDSSKTLLFNLSFKKTFFFNILKLFRIVWRQTMPKSSRAKVFA